MATNTKRWISRRRWRYPDELAREGVPARVIDLYSVKPIDERALLEAAEATGAIVAVEDHHPEGGIGDAVLAVFADTPARPRIVTLAVREMPTSGTPTELLEQAGIDRAHIADTARALVLAQRPGGVARDERDAERWLDEGDNFNTTATSELS